jgi:hypothetical protein
LDIPARAFPPAARNRSFVRNLQIDEVNGNLIAFRKGEESIVKRCGRAPTGLGSPCHICTGTGARPFPISTGTDTGRHACKKPGGAFHHPHLVTVLHQRPQAGPSIRRRRRSRSRSRSRWKRRRRRFELGDRLGLWMGCG